ncbi:MAG: hypothetical protein E4H48_03410 [Syntrophobacterales bacterium]|nr:MAG: hypothetical protein E4H48_03410 [Syntrophobacterales bacterium]
MGYISWIIALIVPAILVWTGNPDPNSSGNIRRWCSGVLVFWVFSVCGLCLTPHMSARSAEGLAFTSAYTWLGGFLMAMVYVLPQTMWRGVHFIVLNKKKHKHAEPTSPGDVATRAAPEK